MTIFKHSKMKIRTRSFLQSVISSSWMLLGWIVFGYIYIFECDLSTERLGDHLIYGNHYRNVQPALMYFIVLTFICWNFYRKTILPVYEVVIRKQVVDKITLLDWVCHDKSGAYLPWKHFTTMHISNEQSVFQYPGTLPDDIQEYRVRIIFLRRSKLVLEVTTVERLQDNSTGRKAVS